MEGATCRARPSQAGRRRGSRPLRHRRSRHRPFGQSLGLKSLGLEERVELTDVADTVGAAVGAARDTGRTRVGLMTEVALAGHHPGLAPEPSGLGRLRPGGLRIVHHDGVVGAVTGAASAPDAESVVDGDHRAHVDSGDRARGAADETDGVLAVVTGPGNEESAERLPFPDEPLPSVVSAGAPPGHSRRSACRPRGR